MGFPLLAVFIMVPLLQAIYIIELDVGISKRQKLLQTFVEIFFSIDLVLSFFKVPHDMLDPTLKKTSMHYIKKFFIPDFLSTVPT